MQATIVLSQGFVVSWFWPLLCIMSSVLWISALSSMLFIKDLSQFSHDLHCIHELPAHGVRRCSTWPMCELVQCNNYMRWSSAFLWFYFNFTWLLSLQWEISSSAWTHLQRIQFDDNTFPLPHCGLCIFLHKVLERLFFTVINESHEHPAIVFYAFISFLSVELTSDTGGDLKVWLELNSRVVSLNHHYMNIYTVNTYKISYVISNYSHVHKHGQLVQLKTCETMYIKDL